jgi:hypothetical protein
MKNRGRNGIRAERPHESNLIPTEDVPDFIIGAELEVVLLREPQDEGREWPDFEEVD